MMNGKDRRRSVILLGVMFILGLYVGYISRHNPGFSPDAVYMGKPKDVLPEARSLHQSCKQSNKEVPSQSLEQNSGVVYDCVMWNPLYQYDTAEVDKNYQTLRDTPRAGEADNHRKNAFVEIYNNQTWVGSKRKLTNVSKDNINYKASGPGSALKVSQGVLAMYHIMIDRLKRVFNKTSIRILDLPCGDLQYMSYFLKTRSDIDYTGADIVPELIAKHSYYYKGINNIHFINIDIVKDDLKDSYDLIICRSMLQHLKNEDVLRTLYHFSSSNSTYLVATTFSNEAGNEELEFVRKFRFRRLNLEKPPISLSPPVCNYKEPSIPHNLMAIWKLPLLQHI